MKKNRILIIIIVLFISIGFAILTSNLDITGTASFIDASFNVHFENANISDMTIDDGNITINNNTTSITSTGTFSVPGDYINTSFYVVNSGTMDASLDSLTIAGLTNELKTHFTYTLTYDIGGGSVAKGDILRAGQGRKMNLHIEYKYDVENLSSANSLNLIITMNYINPKKAVSSNVWNYEYTGGEQRFYVNKVGRYKLETWGAQGGLIIVENTTSITGGYGGYSTGTISLNKNDLLYINVGGEGEGKTLSAIGGYNGGGDAITSLDSEPVSSGGGATHIALVSGRLSTLSPNLDSGDGNVIIVAGGGGGTFSFLDQTDSQGGHGGGYIGVNSSTSVSRYGISYGGTQISGGVGYNGSGSFGLGNSGMSWSGGGGGGYYGGGGGFGVSGAGGSGYIGYKLLTNKIMYCYNCQESSNETDETNIKTRSTTNVSATATSNYAKIGDGFVRITYLGK